MHCWDSYLSFDTYIVIIWFVEIFDLIFWKWCILWNFEVLSKKSWRSGDKLRTQFYYIRSLVSRIWAISIIFNICWNWVQMLIICPVFRIAQNGKKGMVGHSRKLGNSKFQTISSLSLKVMGTQISKNSKKGLKFTRVFSYFITFLLLVLNFRCPLI